MEDQIKGFLLGVRNAFFNEDFEILSRSFVLPLVVYSAAGIVTLKSRSELTVLAERYRRLFSAMPIIRGECRILNRDEPVNQRFRVTARWDDYGEESLPLASSLVRYFLLETAPYTWRIEMLEYIEMAVSLEDAESILH